MEEEKSEVGSTSLQPGDRLSQLHDDLLLRILSELPFREATRTAVLSKRWRHIFPSLPHLRRTSLSVDFPRIYNSLSDTTIAISKSMPADSCLFNLNKLFLKLHSFDERISSSVMFLLNSSPNLEHLVIELEIDPQQPYYDVDKFWNEQTPPECIRNSLKTLSLLQEVDVRHLCPELRRIPTRGVSRENAKSIYLIEVSATCCVPNNLEAGCTCPDV